MIRQGNNTTHTTVSLRLAHAVTPFPTLRPLAPLLPTYLEFHLAPVTPTQKPWAALRTSGMSRDPRLRHQRSLWGPSRGQASAEMPLPPPWAPPPDTCVRSSAWPEAHNPRPPEAHCRGRVGGRFGKPESRLAWDGARMGVQAPAPPPAGHGLRGAVMGASLSLRVPACPPFLPSPPSMDAETLRTVLSAPRRVPAS